MERMTLVSPLLPRDPCKSAHVVEPCESLPCRATFESPLALARLESPSSALLPVLTALLAFRVMVCYGSFVPNLYQKIAHFWCAVTIFA